jgi:hypothetical protein
MRIRKALTTAALAAIPALAEAAPLDVYYERALMTAAGQRCNLFAPTVAAALAAGEAQARGAALRGGASEAETRAVRARAHTKADAQDCRSKDITIAAGRVRDAFAGYAKLYRMSYPGDRSSWQADRAGTDANRWRLAQGSAFSGGRLTFGLAGKTGAPALTALAVFADGATPYSARLVLRDTTRTTGPYLDKRRPAPQGRMPPRSASKVFAAAGRELATKELLAEGAGWAFRFPAAAAEALSGLDPRESVAVEFVFDAGRESVRTAYVEVGDFAAGRAFLQASAR